ncbi:hypothetical protein [Microbacterium sp. HJ5]
MTRSTMVLYWKVIAYSSIVGTVATVAFLMVYYLVFGNEIGWEYVLDACARGVAVGLATTLMVILGTLVTAWRLDTAWGKGLFVLLTFLSTWLGWLLLSSVEHLPVGWEFLFDIPWLPAVLTIGATLIAAVATFFMPSSRAKLSTHTSDPTEIFLAEDAR